MWLEHGEWKTTNCPFEQFRVCFRTVFALFDGEFTIFTSETSNYASTPRTLLDFAFIESHHPINLDSKLACIATRLPSGLQFARPTRSSLIINLLDAGSLFPRFFTFTTFWRLQGSRWEKNRIAQRVLWGCT
jgi:hypothetical protein